ncbi:MAG: ABC transporter ATP-binding protein [Gammaproteobacteria bacterium]|nr:ABC transporter ATP-binding protein [Gammaproteobacteria bacterium]
MSEGSVKLELRQLTKLYGEVRAVDGIDLTVAAGESVVLLGPSGCGKTTTLRSVAGFIRPDGGEIVLDGTVIADARSMTPPEKRRLGMVFQNYAVWPHRTVFQNVAYGLKMAKRPRAEIAQRVSRALELVQLDGLDTRYPGALSGGQQQRVALARALVTEPSMLLLDEPLSNLDAGLREEMRFELKELQQRIGMTTLYVTHDQEEALVLADRIVVMNGGHIEQLGTPSEVYLQPSSRFVASFVGISNLVEGKVESADPAARRISVASGLGAPFWASASAQLSQSLRPGDNIAVAVRPEAIHIVPGGAGSAGDSGIRGRLTKTAFLGNRFDVRLDVNGQELRCQSTRLDFSDEVQVSFDAELAWVVP